MQRTHCIDFFKGILLINMMIDHSLLFGFDSLGFLYRYTYEPLGFVAATEGFIFLSAYLFGLNYSLRTRTKKASLYKSIFSRLVKIYKYHVLSVSVVALLFMFPEFSSNWNIEWQGKLALWKIDPLKAWFLAILFLYQTSFVDILPLYLFLISYSTLPMFFLENGRLKSVLTVSAMLWLLGHLYPQENLGLKFGVLLGWLEFLSWQFLFVIGMAIGFYQKQFNALLPKTNTTLFFMIASTILFFYVRQFHPNLFEDAPFKLTNIRNLGVVRLLNFFTLSYLIYILTQKFPDRFNFSPINQLGKNSLTVFSFHILVCYFFGAFRSLISTQSIGTQIFLLTLNVSLLFIPILFSFVKLDFKNLFPWSKAVLKYWD